jgi:hypothetical protein
LKVTKAEFMRAYELSSDANVPEHQAADYWQLVRYYHGQIFDRANVERALKLIRGT